MVTQPIQPSHPGWVLDEDKALKTKLSGFSVPNYADGRDIPVAVYFRFPDPEERTRTFPHIAIDLTSITAAPERTHRAMAYTLNYNLENNIAPPGSKRPEPRVNCRTARRPIRRAGLTCRRHQAPKPM